MTSKPQRRLRDSFSDHERRLGDVIFEHGWVELERLTDWEALAYVQGTYRYEVRLFGYQTPTQFRSTCTCPAWNSVTACKHAWATLLRVQLELEEVGAFLAVGDNEEGDERDIERNNEEGDEEFVRQMTLARSPLARGQAAQREPQRRRAKARPWQKRLEELQTSVTADDSRPPRIEYRIQPPYPGGEGTMVVQIVRRNFRKKSGDYGAPSRSPIATDVLPKLPEPDRRLLGLYDRDAQERWGSWSVRRSLNLRSDWRVHSSMSPVVLELLAQTGRVFRIDGSGGDPTPCRIDIEEPYRLVVERDPPAAGAAGGSGSSGRPGRSRSAKSGKSAAKVTFRGVLRRSPEDSLPLDPEVVESGQQFAWLEDRVVRLQFDGSEALARELADQPLRVPESSASTVLATLARLPGSARFLADEIERMPVGTPTGLVRIELPRSRPAESTEPLITATVAFDYDGTTFEATAEDLSAATLLPADSTTSGSTTPDSATPGSTAGSILVRRDHDAEVALFERARSAGFNVTDEGESGPDPSPKLVYQQLVCPLNQLPQTVAHLVRDGFRVVAEGKPLRSFQESSGKVSSRIDWFELEGHIDFSDHRASFPELLRGNLSTNGFVELGDGSYGMLPETWVRRLAELRALGAKAEDDLLRLPRSRALLLDAMLSSKEFDFAVDREFAGLRRRMKKFDRLEPVEPPAEQFCGELRPYQKVGLGWLGFLRQFGLGGCLADDMGLGKTVQVLAHLASVQKAELQKPGRKKAGRQPERRPSLLVAPRSVLTNWLRETAKFAPELKVLDFSASDRWETLVDELDEQDLILTTYALLRTDVVDFVESEFRFDTVILDEAQAIKNPQGQTAKSARLLLADHRLALTGTPVENHLGELWSLFEFLNPGMLGQLKNFRSLFGSQTGSESLSANRELIQRSLRPVLLRRTKKEVLVDLPDKIDQVLWCELGPQQRRRYDQLKEHYRKQLLDGDDEVGNEERFQVLEALLRLRQAACHEGLLDKSPKRRAKYHSAKFDAVLPQLTTLAEEGHKVLVFSQFTSVLDLMETELEAIGLRFARLDGRTRKRDEKIEQFRTDPECPVFLISLKAGGVGLNLVEADYVFVLDPWWNPAVEAQAIDRAHRIGQKQTVNAYRVICRDTVEERVLELQQSKKALAEAVLGNERSLLQNLTRDDLDLLLG